MAIQQYLTKSAEETQEVGEKFGRTLSRGETIALYGRLGTGKTTFVQGLARGLGIKEQVVSPSYILMRQYGKGPKEAETTPKLVHIDLYRLESLRQVQDLGLDEVFEDKNSIVVIEWADKLKGELPEHCIKIIFEFIDNSGRKITIEYG